MAISDEKYISEKDMDHHFSGLIIKGQEVFCVLDPVIPETIPEKYYHCEIKSGDMNNLLGYLVDKVDRGFYGCAISEFPLKETQVMELSRDDWSVLAGVPIKFKDAVESVKIDQERLEKQEQLADMYS